MTAHAALLEGLTPPQREAVLHTDGPLLILAGAGSGKTRTVTRRIARLIADGVEPSSILAITFTNKAAGEMRARVRELLGRPQQEPRPRKKRRGGKQEADEPTVATFHAFAARLLRRHAQRLGFGKDYSILDSDDRLALIREAAVSARVDLKRYRAASLGHVIGRAKERLDDEAFRRAAQGDLERTAAEVLPVYRELQRRRNALDFEDLVAGAVRVLEDDEVRAELNCALRYVMIDEYQDTNHSQYRLAQLLAGERRNLAVCGDPDQSIYGWRGADMRNILRFEEEFAGARVVLLEHNYRSTGKILQAANALIGHNAERKEKQLRPVGEPGGPIEVRRCLDAELEANYVAKRAEALIAAGIPANEIAVIYRASVHAEAYEAALLKRNVPCSPIDALSFFERREVKDALAYVKCAVNPNDDLAALRALRAPGRGLGKRSFDKLQEHQLKARCSIVEACARADQLSLTPKKRQALSAFAGLIRGLAAMTPGGGRGSSVEELVAAVLERSGVETYHLNLDERGPQRAANLNLLREAARDHDQRTKRSGVRAFLDRLALLSQSDQENQAEQVVLTTAHASKGLEFDVVFSVGLEEGLFPHRRSLEERGEEEERRLAYVTFTRARKKLILTYAAFRKTRDPRDERRRPSRFLYELPQDLLWDPDRAEPAELPEREPETPAPTPAADAADDQAAGGAPGAPRRKRLLGAPALVGQTARRGRQRGGRKAPAKPARSAGAGTPLWSRPLKRGGR